VRAFAIALCLVGMTTADCWACTCAGVLTAGAELNRSAAVFAGKVLSVRHEVPPGQHSEYQWEDIKHRIRIEKSWKGPSAGRVVSVYTSTGPCGIAFPKGARVMIYANVDKSHRGA